LPESKSVLDEQNCNFSRVTPCESPPVKSKEIVHQAGRLLSV
jgi:hypothetical protein